MLYSVTIEEHIAETYQIEADSIEEAVEIGKNGYKSGTYVLSPGEVQTRYISAQNALNRSDTSMQNESYGIEEF